MNNQDNQAVLNDTNQDTKQPEMAVPDTDSQTTSATAHVANSDTVQEAGSSQSTNPSAPTASAVPDNVKLDLAANQAEMVQDLLSNFTYAYRSDSEVDCKRELVHRDQVGKYPYVAEAPDPSIINPTYDWFNKKWHSKNNAEGLPELEADIQAIKQAQTANSAQSQTITQQMGQMMQMMSGIQTALQTLAASSGTQSTQPDNNAQPTGTPQATTANVAQATTANNAQTTETTQQGGNK